MNARSIFPSLRPRAAFPPRRKHFILLGGIARIARGIYEFLHRPAEFGLAEQKQSRIARSIGATVERRLGRNVGQIYAFAEHVTIHWRFGRSNAKALRENASKVGGTRTMPEKAAITTLDFSVLGLEKSIVLALAFDPEDILQLWNSLV